MYLTCPNEAACGEKDIYPGYNETLVREIDHYNHNFVQNDVCSFVIHAPPEMQENDAMKMKISEITNAVVLVQKSPAGRYMYFSHLDASLNHPGHDIEEALFDTR